MSKHFVITGPESTGKSTLAKLLAKEYGASLKVEYAREYLTKMTSPYIFDDVIVMAREQLKIEQNCDERLTFFDTDLTVFNVWIKEKYGKEIDWINKSLVESKGKTYLLCNVDIPWEYDELREHSSEKDRLRLFENYIELLEKYELPYHIISGDVTSRIKKCKEIIETSI